MSSKLLTQPNQSPTANHWWSGNKTKGMNIEILVRSDRTAEADHSCRWLAIHAKKEGGGSIDKKSWMKERSLLRSFVMAKKISTRNVIVRWDGDEMTHVMWAMIKKKLLAPYVDIRTSTMILASRSATKPTQDHPGSCRGH